MLFHICVCDVDVRTQRKRKKIVGAGEGESVRVGEKEIHRFYVITNDDVLFRFIYSNVICLSLAEFVK